MRLTLAEKGLAYESVIVNLRQNEHKRPEYLAVNPYGLVPAMEDNGIVMYESTIINDYLEEAYPEAPLLPKDAGVRCQAPIVWPISHLRRIWRARSSWASVYRKVIRACAPGWCA